MAKQSGIHQLRGKVGGMKYYGMKGVEGGLVQKINEGMSERVKNGAEYDNTRRNNYEFGMSASTAGSVVKSLSLRWRYLLKPFTTGYMAKYINSLAKADTTHSWGNRVADSETLQAKLPSGLQSSIKNDISDFSAMNLGIVFNDHIPTISLSATSIHNAKAEAVGCDGVRIITVLSQIDTAGGGKSVGVIVPATTDVKILGEDDINFGENVNISYADESEVTGQIVLPYVVLLPYRTINNEKVIMQEFASANFMAE